MLINGRPLIIANTRQFRDSYRDYRRAGCSRLEAAEAAYWICAAGFALARKQREERSGSGDAAVPEA